MHVLGYALTEATALALGIDVEGDSDEWRKMRGWVEDPFWVLRTIGYPPLPADAEGISCGAHKDYGYYTLLHADSTRGALQVFLRDHDPAGGEGGTWINADPVPGTFVVNIGEMVEVLSAGLYKATLHRVIHQAPSYRVSIPFFFEPSYDALIEVRLTLSPSLSLSLNWTSYADPPALTAQPLPSALQLRSQQLSSSSSSSTVPLKPVLYGSFLASKVSGNFASPSTADDDNDDQV